MIKIILPKESELNERQFYDLAERCDMTFLEFTWNEDIDPYYSQIEIDVKIENLSAVANLLSKYIN